MLDALRDSLYRAITTPRGDGFPPLRIEKDLLRRINTIMGSPLCSKDEASRRREARARLAALRASGARTVAKREAAPVLVYFEKDRNARELGRIEETLKAKGIVYKALDLAGDEATLDFVLRTAKCERDELPVVFVASTPVGSFRALVDADVSGRLEKLVHGA